MPICTGKARRHDANLGTKAGRNLSMLQATHPGCTSGPYSSPRAVCDPLLNSLETARLGASKDRLSADWSASAPLPPPRRQGKGEWDSEQRARLPLGLHSGASSHEEHPSQEADLV